MIYSPLCLIPVPEDYVENYKVWDCMHYTESAFKFHPITDKKLFTKFTYKYLRSQCRSRIASFGATLVRIAFLQTGFFADPDNECAISVKTADKLVRHLPDDFVSESSSSQEFIKMVKCFHDNVGELIDIFIDANLHPCQVTYNTLQNTVIRLGNFYTLEVEDILSALSVGVRMLTKHGMHVYQSFSLQDYNLANVEDVIRTDSVSDIYVNVNMTNTVIIPERKPRKVSDRILQQRLYYKLYRAMKRYEREYKRYKKSHNDKRRDRISNISKPSFDPIFLYYSYRKFKFKNIICKI